MSPVTVTPPAPFLNSRFSPSPVVGELLRRRLTSADPSHRLSTLVAHGRPADLPGYGAPSFTLMPAAYTSIRSVQVSDFEDICLLIPYGCLICGFCSSGQHFAFGFLQPSPHGGNLAVRLTLPPAGYVEDLMLPSHLQEGAPCRAHKKKKPE